jgi:hypothetical protein
MTLQRHRPQHRNSQHQHQRRHQAPIRISGLTPPPCDAFLEGCAATISCGYMLTHVTPVVATRVEDRLWTLQELVEQTSR